MYVNVLDYPIINSSDFHPLIKSAVGKAAQSQPVCRCADRQSCRHNGTEYHTRLAKRKRRPMSTDITADTIAGFWENKKP